MKKVLLLANDVTTIVQFRKELILAMVKEGCEVYVSLPKSERDNEILELGAKIIDTTVGRRGKNPFKDLKLLKDYKRIIKEVKPDIVFGFTIKPNVYGGKACAKLKVPFIANITGLSEATLKKGILQKITFFLFKMGLKKARAVFFQNSENMQFFEKNKLYKGRKVLLPGSGVNLTKFAYCDYPKQGEKIKIAFVGRIMKEKGVFELAEAIKQIDSSKVEFIMLGDVEKNGVNPFEGIENVKCFGYQNNVVPYVKEVNALIMPSHHEGMSNVLLEGSAMGRPALASNIAGCKETINDGETGFLFECGNSKSIVEALNKFLNCSYDEMEQMGKGARQKVEKEFDRNIIINKYLEEINKEGK